jgi:hypothetical protein
MDFQKGKEAAILTAVEGANKFGKGSGLEAWGLRNRQETVSR